MKKLIFAALAACTLAGCAYSGVGVSGDKAVIARNDVFLFGMLRKVYVCKVTDGGLTGCSTADNP